MAENYFAQKRRQREAAQGPVQLTPPDPTLPAKTTRANNEAQASGYAPGQAAADLEGKRLTNALNRMEIREQEIANEKAEREAKEAKDAAELDRIAKAGNLQKIERAITLLDGLSTDAADGGGWFETGKSGSFSRKWMGDGTPAYDLQRKTEGVQGVNFIEAIKELKSASKTGSTGAGGLTETEGKKLQDALAVLDPNMSHQEFLDQIGQAREVYLEQYRRLGGNNPMIDPPKNAPPAGDLPPDRQELAEGKTRSEVDPYLRGVAGRVGRMIADPRRYPDAKIREYLDDAGVDPTVTNIDRVLKYRRSPDFIQWQRQNPGQPYDVGPNFYTKDVPLSGVSRTMNAVGGSAPGAYLANSANALTANQMGNIFGEQARTGLALMREESPTASFLGDAAGQAMFEASAGRVPGLRALSGRRFSNVAGDLGYGTLAGSGDGGLEGAITGGLSSAAGGMAGRGLFKGAAGVARGVDNASLGYLNDRNIPLTMGQIGRGAGTPFGNAVGGIEERISRWPIADGIIGGARRRGDEGFNREMIRQVGEPVGNPGNGNIGTAGLADARQIRNDAYSFLDNARLTRDPTYDAANNTLVNTTIPGLPDFGPQVQRKVDLVNGAFDPSGGMTGRDWQSGIRSLRADRGRLASQPFGSDAADALGMAENNLSGIVGRQLPDGNINLANANAVNANFKTVQGALKGRVAQRAGVLTDPTTLNDVAIRGATKFGGIDNALGGKRPFYDLTTAGMEVMPALTPDSGTAGQAILYSALYGGLAGGGLGGAYGAADDQTGAGEAAAAGGGIGVGTALIPTLALAGLYSKPAQKAAQKALLGPRSKLMKKLGQGLGNPFTIGAADNIGNAIARSLLLYPEL